VDRAWAPRNTLVGVARHWKLRAGTLLAAGAYGLHQLRYLLAYGSDSHHELASQGHAYLTFVAPLLAVLVVLSVLELVLRIAGARTEVGHPRAPRLRVLWSAAAAALLGSYSAQELVEGAVSRGHAAGLAGVFAHGGWVAIPLAIVLGLFVALLLRGAARVLELASEAQLRIAPPRPFVSLHRPRLESAEAGSVLARHIGGRGPPLPSV